MQFNMHWAIVLALSTVCAAGPSESQPPKSCQTIQPLGARCGTPGCVTDPSILCDTDDGCLDDCRDSCLSKHRCISFSFDETKKEKKCKLYDKPIKKMDFEENRSFKEDFWAKCCFDCGPKSSSSSSTPCSTSSSTPCSSSSSTPCSSSTKKPCCPTSSTPCPCSSSTPCPCPSSAPCSSSASTPCCTPCQTSSSPPKSTPVWSTPVWSTPVWSTPSKTPQSTPSKTPTPSTPQSTPSSTPIPSTPAYSYPSIATSSSTPISSSSATVDVYAASTCAAAAAASPTYQSPFYFALAGMTSAALSCEIGGAKLTTDPILDTFMTVPFDGYCSQMCFETEGCASFSTDDATGRVCTLYSEAVADFVEAPVDGNEDSVFSDRGCYQCNTGPACNCTVPSAVNERDAEEICGNYSFTTAQGQAAALVSYDLTITTNYYPTSELCAARCFSYPGCNSIAYREGAYCMLFATNYQYTEFAAQSAENGTTADAEAIYTNGCFWCNNLAGTAYGAAQYCPGATGTQPQSDILARATRA